MVNCQPAIAFAAILAGAMVALQDVLADLHLTRFGTLILFTVDLRVSQKSWVELAAFDIDGSDGIDTHQVPDGGQYVGERGLQ